LPQPSRSQERDAAARAALAPLAPGERPWPIVVSALVAFVLGAVTLILYVSGHRLRVGGGRPSLSIVVVYCGLMFACAAGTWTLRYWAVLGFQTLLAIGILGFSLALIQVTSVAWALVCVGLIAGAGVLFWKLVRILGRIQLPTPPRR
jgi:hypothetical protein